MEKNKSKPFGLKDKIGYMFGDLGNDFTFLFASQFLLIFYNKVLGVDAGTVGTLFFVSRLVDAFTDVGMGRIVDTAKPNKAGKFRPWIARFCLPVSFCGFLLFQSWLAPFSTAVKVVYMYITYILWGSFFYTAVNIPYGSMASALTDKPEERASLSTFRSAGAQLASLFIGTITPLIVYTSDADGNQIIRNSYIFTWVAALFSIFALIAYLICYFNTTERVVVEEPKNEQPMIKSLGKILKNKALIGIILTAVACLPIQSVTSSLNNYIFLDVYSNSTGLVIVNFVNPLVAVIIMSPLALYLSKKIGKKETTATFLFIGVILFLILYFVKPDNVYIYILLYVLAFSSSYNGFNVLIWALIIDVIDEQEIKTGSRDDGVVYALYSFARKMGQAIAGAMSGWVLEIINYDNTAVTQTQSVLDGLFTSNVIIPVVCAALAFIFLQFVCPLSKKRIDENGKILAERRNK